MVQQHAAPLVQAAWGVVYTLSLSLMHNLLRSSSAREQYTKFVYTFPVVLVKDRRSWLRTIIVIFFLL